MHGTAVSRSSVLQLADLGSYPSEEPREHMGLVAGRPHKIECVPIKCFPKASYSWALSEKERDNQQIPIHPDDRVQIDDDGVFT